MDKEYSYSPAKLALIDFIKNSKEDLDYEITLTNFSEKEARAFLQQMRVELSRMRGILRSQGKVIRRFKLLLVKVESFHKDEGGIHEISSVLTIRRSLHGLTKTVEGLREVFGLLESDEDLGE